MKALVSIFVCFATIFIFGYIYFQSALIGLLYKKQRQERELARLSQEQAILLQDLESMQSLGSVDAYARGKLGMIPTSIRQVYKTKRAL